MNEFAVLGAAIVFAFIGFVVYWNKKWKGQILDERELLIRLKVRELISRAVEIALVLSIGYHFLVHPLAGMQIFILVGMPGVLAEAFGNWYLRREQL